MEITKHICFSKKRDADMISFLRKNGILNRDTDSHLISIDIYVSDPCWPEIEKYIAQKRRVCLTDMIFTANELAEAEWMAVRTIWRTGYPEPTSGFAYKDITYNKEHYCNNCGAGLEQKAPFRLVKTPSWGRRHFFAPYGLEDELFVDESVRRIFESNGITGVKFASVQNKNGQKDLLNIYQMKIPNKIPKGLVMDSAAIRSITPCPVCGREKILRYGGAKMQFYRNAFEGATDAVKTTEIFGGLKAIAGNVMLVNQKTYQVIKKSELGRSLMFYPVDLVD